MIEKLITSKARVKILKLFLTHIDNRYYLREIERILDESLSPLRRQLLKLTTMGILTVQSEGNLKYYSLNKNFEGIEGLKKLVLGEEIWPAEFHAEAVPAANPIQVETPRYKNENHIRYDIVFLSAVSIFILITAIFTVYINSRNIDNVVNLVSEKNKTIIVERKSTTSPMPDEMMSRRWKVLPGNAPVLSSGVYDDKKKTKEL